jgi:hypothetical protein
VSPLGGIGTRAGSDGVMGGAACGTLAMTLGFCGMTGASVRGMATVRGRSVRLGVSSVTTGAGGRCTILRHGVPGGMGGPWYLPYRTSGPSTWEQAWSRIRSVMVLDRRPCASTVARNRPIPGQAMVVQKVSSVAPGRPAQSLGTTPATRTCWVPVIASTLSRVSRNCVGAASYSQRNASKAR